VVRFRDVAGTQVAGASSYTYDPVAGRLQTLWHYGGGGYGDRSGRTGPRGGVSTYGYDQRGWQTAVTDQLTATLTRRTQTDYDPAGHATTQRYGYDDQGNVWADLDGSNALQTRRLYTDRVDELAARIQYSGGVSVAWYLLDRQGSVRDLMTSTGAAQGRQTFDGFGNVQPGGTLSDRYGYTGREWDGQAKLQYNRDRWYDPVTGRWTSRDPLEFEAGDTNLYRYAGNNPTNASDPSGLAGEGLQPEDIYAAALGPLYEPAVNALADVMYNGVGGNDYQYTAAEVKVNRQLAAMGREPLAKGPSSYFAVGQALLEGLGDGALITANTWSFGQVGELDAAVAKRIQENGELYAWADASSKLGREILLFLATRGVGSTVGRCGLGAVRWALPAAWTGRLATVATVGGRLAQPVFAGYQAYQVAQGGYDAYRAYQRGDTPGAALALARTGINGIGLRGSVGESLKLARAARAGPRALAKYLFETSCFAAGTPLLTPGGSRPVERFAVGDLLLSRSEFDPEGPVEAKVVEEVFVRTGRILELRVGGRVVQTTAEHPFFARGKGWVAAGGGLRAGDLLASHDGRWVAVEGVEDTGAWATVYNLRVADHHTYFVGSGEWGFSVWAHNACVYQAVDPGTGEVRYVGVANRGLTYDQPARPASAEAKTGVPASTIPGLDKVGSLPPGLRGPQGRMGSLTPEEASEVEATLIRFHGRPRYGGTLANQRPGDNVSTPESYKRAIERGSKLLHDLGYPGFEDLENILWKEPPRF
jgi:RHS repeat-associated protein